MTEFNFSDCRVNAENGQPGPCEKNGHCQALGQLESSLALQKSGELGPATPTSLKKANVGYVIACENEGCVRVADLWEVESKFNYE